MINLYDIIEAINTTIPKEKGQLVLHRSFTPHPKFKIYKKFHYGLYLIKRAEKTFISSNEFVENTSDIDTEWDKCDKLYLLKIIEWLSSNEYKELKDV